MLKHYLNRAIKGEVFQADEMATAMGLIMEGQAPAEQVAGLLVALRCRGESVGEITGAARAMRQRMTQVKTQRRPLIDTCGTGGDGAHTFNISTAVAFVVAAAGVAVAKHGNRAVSSRAGSADVLQALGVDIGAPVHVVQRCIDELGLGFLFAPALHPAMAHAAPIRQALGVRTIFNLLGPLTNPAGATCQLMGVFAASLVAPLAQVLGNLGSTCAWVVHGEDGLDEISVCDVTHVAKWNGQRVETFTLTPEAVGIQRTTPDKLRGGDATHNAQMLTAVLAGHLKGPVCDAVALNAGAALCVAGMVGDLHLGVQKAYEVLQTGRGLLILQRVAAMTTQPV